MRTDDRSRSAAPGARSSALNRPGVEKKRVGRCCSIVSKILRRSGRSGSKTLFPPNHNGKARLLHNPYAWYIFEVEKATSFSLTARTCLPYVWQTYGRSCCRWTTPFGRPVEPEL